MTEQQTDPAIERAVKWAQLYANSCSDVVQAAQACIKVASDAVGARNMANTRPQHEISIAHFAKIADEADQQFKPLYADFSQACATARDHGASLLGTETPVRPEVLLMTALDDDAYNATGTAAHILRAGMRATPATFLEDLQVLNAALEADVFVFGEPGFQDHIVGHAATASASEKTCPWCAETIKAAAIVCRFCNREV